MQVSIAAGSWLGLIVVGLVADALGWRAAFVAMGLPGFILAVLIAFTMQEPERGRFASVENTQPPPANWLLAIREVMARRTVMHLLIGFAIVSFCGSGASAWLVLFLCAATDWMWLELVCCLAQPVALGRWSVRR